eukprot:scaffold174157_cov29-Tisochrysis_lutea.AAC.4
MDALCFCRPHGDKQTAPYIYASAGTAPSRRPSKSDRLSPVGPTTRDSLVALQHPTPTSHFLPLHASITIDIANRKPEKSF